MSRSADDWTRARRRAMDMRNHVHDIGGLLDDWPVEMDEVSELCREASDKLDDLEAVIQQIIGRVSPRWVDDELMSKTIGTQDLVSALHIARNERDGLVKIIEQWANIANPPGAMRPKGVKLVLDKYAKEDPWGKPSSS